MEIKAIDVPQGGEEYEASAILLTGTASNPSPADGTAGVAPGAVLTWTLGPCAASHKVYFGTNLYDVNDAATSTFKGDYAEASYDPGPLDICQTYYWRIDEVNDAHPHSPWKGRVWKFSTSCPDFDDNGLVDFGDLKKFSMYWLSSDCENSNGCEGTDLNYDGCVNEIDFANFAEVWLQGLPPGEAIDPIPADGMSRIEPNAVLSWVPGDYTTVHDMYFGRDCNEVRDANLSSSIFMGSQDVNSWDPCGLESDTTYYWRIDERNSFASTKGQVWQFTTKEPFVAHWAFDETSGITAPDLAGTNDGEVHGALWTSGKINGALSFDGIDDYVDCGDSDILAPEFSTISFWMLPEGSTSNRYILGKASDLGYSREYTVSTDGAGKLVFYFGEDIDKRVEVRSRFGIPTGQWLHVVLTRDGSKASLYINGRLDTSASYSFRPTNMGYNLRIGSVGSSDGWAGYFKGKLDDVRIYDETLTEKEIEQLCIDINDAYRLEDFETGSLGRFPWTTYTDSASNGEWSVTSNKAHTGVYSARAGTINDNESTSLEVKIECQDGNISFWRKVSSEQDCAELGFCIDHKWQKAWSGNLDWEKVSFSVSKGIRTFTWTYSKQVCGAESEDTAWIDDIIFP